MRIADFIFIASLAIVSSGPAAAEEASDAKEKIFIGVNKFDLLMQYLGIASRGDGGDAYRRVTRAMARKALADANAAGIKLMRVSVVGYSPGKYGGRSDLELWQTDPDAYWTRVNEMFDDLDRNGIQLVPVLMWNAAQFPAMTRETVGDLIIDSNSKSWKLLSLYVADFVSRYRRRPTIKFYELTNELNLLVDIDNVARCKRLRSEAQCERSSNFTTDDLIKFTGRYAALIRSLDDTRQISSGFSIPRASAEHLRASRGRSWAADSREQFREYLKDIHQSVDIISIHLYAGKQNQRFRSTSEMDVLVEAKLASDEAGKPLFVGEFGEPDARNANSNSHTAQVLEKISELKIPYGAVWAWEFYQHKLFKTHESRDHAFNLEPGYTDFLIGRLEMVNGAGRKPGRAPIGKEASPPRVVLSWPLECAIMYEAMDMYAVASDDSGAVQKVEFLLDGKVMARDNKPPYQAIFSPIVSTGVHQLTARAYDLAGNVSEYSSTVIVGNKSEKVKCTVSGAQ